MTLISASNLSKSYGAVDIFTGVSLSIPPGARIAIVGPNGIGKTTLLRVLFGLEDASTGRMIKARNLEIGYLPQEASFSDSHTLWEECLRAVSDLRSMEAELTRLEGLMSDAQEAEKALEKYGALQETFEQRGGYTYETLIKQILTGLGFEERDYHRPLPQLSGGERTRALLAHLLVSAPDLLILDEPTNHLDISAVEWLENYLSQWDGAALIVSHDRYFLDQVVDTVWEMSAMGMENYRGNYSAYVQQRQDRWDLRQRVYELEKARLEKELDYIKRNIAAQRTQHAKGKLKRLSRQIQAIEQAGIEAVQEKSWATISSQVSISEHTLSLEEVERRIRALRKPSNRPPQLKMDLKSSHCSGDLVIRTKGLEIGYQDDRRSLFRAPDLLLKRGECAAVIGPNGAGKTTFLKTLLGEMPPLRGEVTMGASLRIGYFAQAHEDLRPGQTLVEEIENVAAGMLLADIRDYLARYLFTGEDVFRQVATLSGGERGRLALAKLSLAQANLLLLDEPTNHLDIPSQEILQEVLGNFQGTMLLVSHDRYLIDALSTQIWDIQPDQASMQVFEGTYSQYREHLARVKIEPSGKAELKKDEKITAERRQLTPSSLTRKKRARLVETESQIITLETALDELSSRLENPPDDIAEVQKLGREYVHLQEQLEGLMDEWEQLSS